VSVPLTSLTTSLPITFRQSATDADNHGVADIAAVYVQEQIALTRSSTCSRACATTTSVSTSATTAQARTSTARIISSRPASAWSTSRSRCTAGQLPKHSASLWNKLDLSSAWGVGLGIIHRGEIFTSTDNTVTRPGFTRVDAAIFYTFNQRLRAQLNVENLLDTGYYLFANSNTNITPGSPRGARISLTTRF
jgi:outer membrane receptor protein involved in Fe transport